MIRVVIREYENSRGRIVVVFEEGEHIKQMTRARFVWEESYGPVPDGFTIHHADFDRQNDDRGNLVCLTFNEHIALHEHQEGVRVWCGGVEHRRCPTCRALQPVLAEFDFLPSGRLRSRCRSCTQLYG